MKENFPNLAKEIDMQVQDTQRVSKKLNTRRNISRHIIIKLPKIKEKERISKVARQKERRELSTNSPYESAQKTIS